MDLSISSISSSNDSTKSSSSNSTTTLFKRFPIFQRCPSHILIRIKHFVVLGPDGEDIILITHNDRVLAYGKNENGILGVGLKPGTVIDGPTEIVQLAGKQIVEIVHGWRHVTALTKSGEVYCWGRNEFGQCGNGTTNDCLVPTMVKTEETFISIKSGYFHTMALSSRNSVYVWGNIEYRSNLSLMPTELPNVLFGKGKSIIVAIECGSWHYLALAENGTVYCWGRNEYGQLGFADNMVQDNPRKLNFGVEDEIIIVGIAAGLWHSLFLTNHGKIYACGSNKYGQFGQQQTELLESITPPVRLQFKKNDLNVRFKSIAASLHLSIGLSDSCYCYVWGGFDSQSAICNEPPGKLSLEPIETRLVSIEQTFSEYMRPLVTPSLTSTRFMFTNSVSSRLESKFNDPSDSDLHFMIGNRTIYVHSGFLIISSNYMKDLIQLHRKNCNNLLTEEFVKHTTITSIKIVDYKYSVFFAYLYYLYTGMLECSSNQDLFELLRLSIEYEDCELTNRCIVRLSETITVQNCLQLFELSEQYQLNQLKLVSIDFIKQHCELVRKSKHWLECNGNFLCEKVETAIGFRLNVEDDEKEVYVEDEKEIDDEDEKEIDEEDKKEVDEKVETAIGFRLNEDDEKEVYVEDEKEVDEEVEKDVYVEDEKEVDEEVEKDVYVEDEKEVDEEVEKDVYVEDEKEVDEEVEKDVYVEDEKEIDEEVDDLTNLA